MIEAALSSGSSISAITSGCSGGSGGVQARGSTRSGTARTERTTGGLFPRGGRLDVVDTGGLDGVAGEPADSGDDPVRSADGVDDAGLAADCCRAGPPVQPTTPNATTRTQGTKRPARLLQRIDPRGTLARIRRHAQILDASTPPNSYAAALGQQRVDSCSATASLRESSSNGPRSSACSTGSATGPRDDSCGTHRQQWCRPPSGSAAWCSFA